MRPVDPAAFCAGTCIVRRLRLEEIDSVWKLASSIPTAAHWTRRDYDAYCRAADARDTQAKAIFVVWVSVPTVGKNLRPPDEAIVGFAAFSALLCPDGECTLENMAVDKTWRRQGLAQRLLTAGLLWCRAWCGDGNPEESEAGLLLETRASNREAIAFYEHCGFLVTGTRPGYYPRPDEDAVLMSKPFHSSQTSR